MKFSYDLIFFIILITIILCMLCNSNDTEKFDNVASADIEAIRNLNSIATKLTAGQLTSPGNMTVTGNMNANNLVNTPSLNRVGGDWLRVNDQGVGRVALHGSLAVNGTYGGFNGLAVGTWNSNVGEGNIAAAGNISAGNNISAGGNMAIGGYGNVKATLDDIYAKINGINQKLTGVSNENGTLKVSGDVFMGGSTLGFNNREDNIVASGGYFHMAGPNNRGSRQVAAGNFIGWQGW